MPLAVQQRIWFFFRVADFSTSHISPTCCKYSESRFSRKFTNFPGNFFLVEFWKSKKMRKCELLDLEKQFAFYGAYHSNQINIVLHMMFVWPIGITFILILYFSPSLYDISMFDDNLVLPLNFSLLVALGYSLLYISMDPKSGSFTAFLIFFCWFCSSLAALHLGFSITWKIVLVVQIVCWTGQFIGHLVFEKRAPALLDNLVQAFLMAPFFVILEGLQASFGYEPYPGFHASVQSRIAAEISEWEAKKHRLIS